MDMHEKIKTMLGEVKSKGEQSLSSVFYSLASKWNMKKNSVRNLFYATLKELKRDKDLQVVYNFDVSEYKQKPSIPFSKDEIDDMVKYIDEMVCKGCSVRSACVNLARGDAKLMLRYQNKYRSIKKLNNKRTKKLRVVQTLKEDTTNSSENKHKFLILDEMPDNVIPFRKKESYLTDKELQSLFLGLVRIVKNSAVAEVNNALKQQCNFQSIEIRNLLKRMTKIREEMMETKRENDKLKKQIELLKASKIEKYANFIESIKSKNNLLSEKQDN